MGIGIPTHWVAVRVNELSFERHPERELFPTRTCHCDTQGKGFWKTVRAPGGSSPAMRTGARLVVSMVRGQADSLQGQGLAGCPLGALSPHWASAPTAGTWVAVPEWERKGARDEEPGEGERARLEGKSGPRQAQGGARRGAQGRRAGGSPGG